MNVSQEKARRGEHDEHGGSDAHCAMDPPDRAACSCPMTGRAIVDRCFLEARSKLLDLAAFLDRLDRANDGDARSDDFRILSLRRAARELVNDEPGRTRRIQELLSDPTTEPIVELSGKGAVGAWAGLGGESR